MIESHFNFSFLNRNTGVFQAAILFALVLASFLCGAANAAAQNKIVFYSDRDFSGGKSEIMIANADGSNLKRLTYTGFPNDAIEAIDPSWSANGSKIVFGSGRGGFSNTFLYVMNADGSNRVDIGVNDAPREIYPSFSPDGNSIIYGCTINVGNESSPRYETCRVSASGGIRTVLTDRVGYAEQARYSPDGSKIVFRGAPTGDVNFYNLEIYVMNADGTNQVRLTDNTTSDSYPVFSPDGTKITFSRGGFLWTMNADGTNQTRLTPISGYTEFDTKPDYSPDGSQIFFQGNTNRAPDSCGRQRCIYKINADGTNLTSVNVGSFAHYYGDMAPRVAAGTVPAVTAPNAKIVFYRDNDSANPGTAGIWTMNADGGNRVQLTNVNGHSDPAFSADGKKIVFDDGGGLSVMNADGSNINRIYASNSVTSPTFSPDNTKILFEAYSVGGYQVYTINVNGSNLLQISSGNPTTVGATWSPDGTKIVYSGWLPQINTYHLYSITPDGGNKINLTNNTELFEYSPSFSPDGNKVVFTGRERSVQTRSATAFGGIPALLSSDLCEFPNYSPGGGKIVCSRYDGIWTMNADGGNRTKITNSNTNIDLGARFYKPALTAAAAPSGLVAWFPGDGNARDLSGNGNHGTFNNAANANGNYAANIGQAFDFDGVSDYVSVPDSAALNTTGDMTVEGWIYPTNFGRIFAKSDSVPRITYLLEMDGSGSLSLKFTDAATNTLYAYQMPTLPLNQWTHLGISVKSTGITVSVNGVAGTLDASIPQRASNSAPLIIGANLTTNGTPTGFFGGKIDELSIYNRALSDSELQTIYNTGKFGKIKQAAFTAQTSIPLSAATVNFNSAQSGTAREFAIDAATLPAVPLAAGRLVYDVEASAPAAGASVCFDAASLGVSPSALRVFHLENNAWVDRTVSASGSSVCASNLPSFSPFAVGQLDPTAANVAISGRVTTANGRGIRGARVTLTGSGGEQRTAVSNSLGYYEFAEVPAGETYVVGASAKRYTFQTRVLSITEAVGEVDFVADN